MCLEVKELKVVCTLVPLVLVAIEAGAGLRCLLLIHFESLIHTKVKVITHSRAIMTTRRLLANIGAWTDSFGCYFKKKIKTKTNKVTYLDLQSLGGVARPELVDFCSDNSSE